MSRSNEFVAQQKGAESLRRRQVLGALGAVAGSAIIWDLWAKKDISARLFNPFSLDKFALQAVPGLKTSDGAPLPGFSSADLGRRLCVLNLWASWCGTCLEEHALLVELASRRLAPIYGADVKDEPDHARAFLARHGNPFDAVGADDRSYLMRALGVRGVPATFVVAPGPRIVVSLIGALDRKDIETTLVPALSQTN
jgi:cytochrome c biogenesis protein CcmG/thiol:disulfide interchange protein DsbE